MITLVLGGARSGKSAHAERLAAALPAPVTYVATAAWGDGALGTGVGADAEMAERVAAHRRRRPTEWRTVEAGADLAATLAAAEGTVLVDSLGGWVARLPAFAADGPAVAGVLKGRRGDAVVVSEEVGLGVHPSSAAGRRFRDALGEVNQAVAGVADEVVLVVAGRVLRLESAPPAEPGRR